MAASALYQRDDPPPAQHAAPSLDPRVGPAALGDTSDLRPRSSLRFQLDGSRRLPFRVEGLPAVARDAPPVAPAPRPPPSPVVVRRFDRHSCLRTTKGPAGMTSASGSTARLTPPSFSTSSSTSCRASRCCGKSSASSKRRRPAARLGPQPRDAMAPHPPRAGLFSLCGPRPQDRVRAAGIPGRAGRRRVRARRSGDAHRARHSAGPEPSDAVGGLSLTLYERLSRWKRGSGGAPSGGEHRLPARRKEAALVTVGFLPALGSGIRALAETGPAVAAHRRLPEALCRRLRRGLSLQLPARVARRIHERARPCSTARPPVRAERRP